MNDQEVTRRAAELLSALGARAAGYWRVEQGRLTLGAFVPAPDLDAEVGRRFAEATRTIPEGRLDLAIVQAQRDGSPRISVADELPPETGSGYWLRAFRAACSVAVPLLDESGRTVAVISAALPQLPLPDDQTAVIARIRAAGQAITEG